MFCSAMFALVLISIGNVDNVFADVQDFYFEDFTADYYLTKDAEGLSHLQVVENVTAVFPDFKQNKGICRQISFTNQDGANVTLPSLTRSNIKVMRNGMMEPIYSIEKGNGYYDVCTGTEEYLLGTQLYTFEYEFDKVVTEFNENGREWQELYWDTNGNGATQRFNKVTARVHLENKDWWAGKSWCYVGSYGKSEQDRCEMTELSDGIEFTAIGIAAYENLTFDMELKSGIFVVPEPEKDYAYVWILIGLSGICIAIIVLSVLKFVRIQDKVKYYKGLFVKPEYQPNAEYGLTEMAEIYMGKKEDVKVAMLLELAVKKKIELVKEENKKWSINVKNLDGINKEYIDLLSILDDGSRVEAGSKIEIKNHTARAGLILLMKEIENKIKNDLEKDGLATSKWRYGINSGRLLGELIAIAVIVVFAGLFVSDFLEGIFGLNGNYGAKMVFAEYYHLTSFIIIVLTVFITVWFLGKAKKYEAYTFKGLEMSRYMDGLKLYISMAEAERMKMLQSADGVDTSPEELFIYTKSCCLMRQCLG